MGERAPLRGLRHAIPHAGRTDRPGWRHRCDVRPRGRCAHDRLGRSKVPAHLIDPPVQAFRPTHELMPGSRGDNGTRERRAGRGLVDEYGAQKPPGQTQNAEQNLNEKYGVDWAGSIRFRSIRIEKLSFAFCVRFLRGRRDRRFTSISKSLSQFSATLDVNDARSQGGGSFYFHHRTAPQLGPFQLVTARCLWPCRQQLWRRCRGPSPGRCDRAGPRCH